MFSKNNAIPIPCVNCNGEELRQLHQSFDNSDGDFWVYCVAAYNCCDRCDKYSYRKLWRNYPLFRDACCVNPFQMVQVPLPVSTVGTIERAVQASCIASKGSDYRAHGTFISHLSLLDCPEIMKQSLCVWAPKAMIDFGRSLPFTSRIYRKGRLNRDSGATVAKEEIDTSRVEAMCLPPPNQDCENGEMLGTNLETGNEYGEEKRISGDVPTSVEPKVLAHQIGPDLIPTEVFESTYKNLKGGLAKRVQPLPFKAKAKIVRKIDKVVTTMIKEVFSEKKIKEWREQNPDIDEFKSSKWSSDRWIQAVEEALSDTQAQIEQTFQIKVNEALPAKGKAPRPIIQCGDRAQAMMNLPVKCFEDLLFHHFEDASIKHIDKLGAMKRVSSHLQQRGAKLLSGKAGDLQPAERLNMVEGDGSAWDSCCNPIIRSMTENRVIRHIITILGNDPQVPKEWMNKVIADMDKKYLKGKAKVSDFCTTPLKVMIDSIRQSGHRGTSCMNYFINLVCWLVVVCDEPEKLIKKNQRGKLRCSYVSPRDKQTYKLFYAFEGDDSVISVTEDLNPHAEEIEEIWTSMGFRMKLVYVKEKLTFTGYDFLVDKNGPTSTMLPEIARNISSSSWTCSSLVKMDPSKKHEVGMAAMLARAVNFKECGPFSRYFASLGLAHARKCGDRELGEDEAKGLGLNSTSSIVDDLHELYNNAEVMSADMRKLVNLVIPFTHEDELRMLTVDFGDDPCNLVEARRVVPFAIWNPKNFDKPRR